MTNQPMKIVVLCAVAVACATAVQGQGVVKQRAFSYGLTLREGYDSNIYSRTDSVKGSFSTTASPDFQYGWNNADTDITAHYGYSAVYYNNRPEKSMDQSHNLNVTVGHEFSPRLRMVFADDFAPGFEPDLEEGTSHRSADYIQNTIRLNTTYTLNNHWDMSANVRHYFINYSDDSVLPVFPGTPTSQTMNRQSYEAEVGVNYQPRVATSMGVTLGLTATSYSGNDRDNLGQRMGFNIRHIFNPRLSADANLGAQLQTFDAVGGQSLNPDINMGLNYLVTSRTSLAGRFSTRMTPTEVASYLEQQSFMVSGNVVHQFTSRLMGTAGIVFVPSEFQGGMVVPGATVTGNRSETSIMPSCMMGYQFNVHLRGEIGYSFTHFESDMVGRSYDRHMTFLQARVGF